MAKVSILNIDNINYDIEDATARNSIETNSIKIDQLEVKTSKNEKMIEEIASQGISAVGVDENKVPLADGKGKWDWKILNKIGVGLKTTTENEVALGCYNETNDNTILSIGIGSSNSDRKNVLTISKNNGFVFGENCVSSGNYSFAQGGSCIAEGDYSSSQGSVTKAEGHSAHSEGGGTLAKGDYSHAEGSGSKSIGLHSHAEGYYTEAIGESTHASGMGTRAVSDYSTAIGKYNKYDTNKKYAFQIGNGNVLNNSDAFNVKWDGTVEASGDIKATDENGNKISLIEVSKKELNASGITQDYVPTANGDGTWSWKEQQGSGGTSYFTIENGHLVFNSGTNEGLDDFRLNCSFIF